MVQDDIPGVRGAAGGSGGRQEAPRGAREVKTTPGAKMSDKNCKKWPQTMV